MGKRGFLKGSPLGETENGLEPVLKELEWSLLV